LLIIVAKDLIILLMKISISTLAVGIPTNEQMWFFSSNFLCYIYLRYEFWRKVIWGWEPF
jgi:hypothetical protein